jgi:hypothetical protein
VADPTGEILISVYGLHGLGLPDPSEVRLSRHLGEIVPEPQGPILPMSGRDLPQVTEPEGPIRIDPIHILFADEEHLLHDDASRLSAFAAARAAAVNHQGFGVVIQTANALQVQTFTVVDALGQAAGVSEVPIYVPSLR